MKIVAFLFAIIPINVSAQMGGGALTVREQALLLQNASVPASIQATTTMPSWRPLLADIEQSIRRANPLDVSLRTPVPEVGLRRIQINQLLQGKAMTLREIAATTDTSQALMRRSPGRTLSKLTELLSEQEGDAAFHGNVAEFAEARARGMILTKNPRSQMWDLTENKFQPSNYQMKIYAQSDRALSSLRDDLDGKEGFMRRGITTQETLNEGLMKGTLEQIGDNYRYVGRSDIELEPSRVFLRPAESRRYTQTGRDILQETAIGDAEYPVEGVVNVAFGALMLYNELPPTYEGIRKIINGEDRTTRQFWDTGRHMALATSGGSLLSAEIANILKYQSFSKWAGRGGWVTFGIAEGVSIYEWNAGYMNNREFVTSQAGIGGGVGGAWVGQRIGGWIGSGLGVGVGVGITIFTEGSTVEIIPEAEESGNKIGKIGGAFIGTFWGSNAGVYGATTIYESLDEKQKEEVEAFTYQHYGVPHP